MATTAEDRHEEELPAETAQVVGWRFQQLYDAGYDLSDARIIARRIDVDLHEAVEWMRTTGNSALARRLAL